MTKLFHNWHFRDYNVGMLSLHDLRQSSHFYEFIVKSDLDISDMLDSAKKELEKQIQVNSDGLSKTWGYFPGHQLKGMSLNSCEQLGETFANGIEAIPLLQQFRFNLAFVRLATGEPESDFGGLHVDVDTGVGHIRPAEYPWDKYQIFRLLINLGDKPRSLQFCHLTLAELAIRGCIVNTCRYAIYKSENSFLKNLTLKPREDRVLHCLLFPSSDYLHAGVTNEDGHFLMAFGSFVNRKKDLLKKRPS